MNKIICYLYRLSVVSLVLCTTSCSNDDTFDFEGNELNQVYINMQIWHPINLPANSYFYSFSENPESITLDAGNSAGSEIIAKIAIKSTHYSSLDVKVNLEEDYDLLINEYEKIPSNVKYTIDKEQLTISSGSLSSDTATVSISPEYYQYFTEGNYMLPIRIASATNANVNQEFNVVYLVFSTTYNNCNSGATSVSNGTLVSDRSSWKATIGNVDVSTTITDGDNTYYAATGAGPFVLTVNLGDIYSNITGFRLNFSSQNYSIIKANVYTKENENDEYTYQGTTSITRSATQYIEFIGQINARYIQLEVTPYSSNGIRIREFYVYTN